MCWWLTIWRTLRHWWHGDFGATVSGHDYVESEIHQEATVQILMCRICGHTSVGWKTESVEARTFLCGCHIDERGVLWHSPYCHDKAGVGVTEVTIENAPRHDLPDACSVCGARWSCAHGD